MEETLTQRSDASAHAAGDEVTSKELRASESRYRRLFETAQDGIILLNADSGQIEDVNPYLIDLLGYSHTEFTGRKLWEVGPFVDIALSKQMFEKLQTEGYVRYDDLPLTSKSGKQVEVEFVSNSYLCEGKKVIQCNIREIGTQKRIEKALADSELRTRRLLQAGNVGLWDWDLLTQETYFSPEWKLQLGYADHELSSDLNEWLVRIHPDDRAATLAAVAEFRDGRRASYDVEFRLRHKNGSWRLIVARASLVRDYAGTPVRMMGSHIDDTARHLAQAQAREATDRYAAIVDASPDAIVAVDADERVRIFNAAAERMFRTTSARAVGGKLEQHLPLRHRASHAEHIRQFGQTSQSPRAMGKASHLMALREDGTEFPIEASISRVSTVDGPLFTAIIRDITESESAEAARAQLEEQLRQSQKMEAIGTLAGGIAHDFNNIIATVLGNVELAREDAGANSHVLDCLGEISKAGGRARDLVRQILAFSRRQSTERKVAALEPIVAESARLLRALFPARVTLDVQCDSSLPLVLVDAVQMQQVLINLATNALQAIRSRPGRILIRLDTLMLDAASVRARPVLRALYEAHPGLTVRLTVSDDGPGMDATTLQRSFEPFFTTKPVGEGTGLGLCVVLGIVQGHDGVITADSAPGHGATFAIYLPVAARQADSPAPGAGHAATPAAVERGRGRHVLYLDDEYALVYMVVRFLQRRGFQASGYTSQKEALEAIRANPSAFDLVVSDYNMPGMSGLDVVREVRAIRADLPVTIASGFVDDELRALAAGVGVHEVVFKATNLGEFCTVVQRLLEPNETLGAPLA